MKIRSVLLALLLLCLTSTRSTAQSFADVKIVAAPDVHGWPETARITKIVLTPGDVRIEFNKADSWPEAHVPGWGDPNFSDQQKANCNVPGIDNGCIQFTLWPVIQVNGEWFTTGALEFWKHKDNVGGPFSNAGQDWYDKMPPMAHVQPQPGQRVGFMVVAGDQRLKDVRSILERSEVAWFTVPQDDTGTFTFSAPAPGPTPTPTPTPVPTPVPVPPSPDLTALSNRVSNLEDNYTRVSQAVQQNQAWAVEAIEGLRRFIADLSNRIVAVDAEVTMLKAHRVPVECRANVAGIPISCKLVF